MKKIYFLSLFLSLFTSVNAQIINIPDANFKAKLLQASTSNQIAKDNNGNNIVIDTNNDGEIEVNEALLVMELAIPNANITDLTGINAFINMDIFDCSNNQISSLSLPNLTALNCSHNNLSVLSVVPSIFLETLDCSHNNLVSLNLSSCPNIYELTINNNNLSSMIFPLVTNLYSLNIQNNNFNGFDLSNINVESSFYFGNNPNDTVLFPNNLSLYQGLHYSSNSALSLDLTTLKNFGCGGPPDCNGNITIYAPLLENIFLKNGCNYNLSCWTEMGETVCYNPFDLNISNCPNLKYFCTDEGIESSHIVNELTQLGLENQVQVNSYCSFTPGGTYYTIQGNVKLDANNNGCDVADNAFPNLKFNITDGINNGNLISNISGNYTIPVQAGTHTVNPFFENPTYFNVSPPTVNVTFPTQLSPFTQNFCVTTNGIHPDLEVTLLPIIDARPGFDAVYKLIYKNKGNTSQSGTLNLTYDDAVLDFVSSNPITTSQTANNLSWNFTDLLPFETREVTLTLNVNSPMETPAVNGGDILNYTTTINSVAIDEIPNDNVFIFNQTVVNSYDPNDKTCLEGMTIAPEKVGDYVHYIIRFENNGSANAQNIVVKDMIDVAKFDIYSIVPIKGSHSFVTNITQGNKVEFIFENINLPFDDANNDGYVSFKVKTLPTLANGDTFSNTASIYFDYNFPIVTNTAETTIAALSVQNFEFSNYFNLYPNPVLELLYISTKENISVSSINIYNILGQLVLVIPNAENTKSVNVSNLMTGNYFIKINSDKGTSNTKFIKN